MISNPSCIFTPSPPSISLIPSISYVIILSNIKILLSLHSYSDYPRGEQRNSNQPLLLPVNTFMLTDDKREELVSEELLIPRDDLQLVAEIGEGNFGIVFKGLLKISHDEDPREVAVKTLKPPRRKCIYEFKRVFRHYKQ